MFNILISTSMLEDGVFTAVYLKLLPCTAIRKYTRYSTVYTAL